MFKFCGEETRDRKGYNAPEERSRGQIEEFKEWGGKRIGKMMGVGLSGFVDLVSGC